MATKFTSNDIQKIATLANIPVSDAETEDLADAFTKTIAVVEKLNSVDVTSVTAVHMTGLSNVFREDSVDEARMFSQKEALANAKNTHNGYFVVQQVIDQDA